MVLNSNTRIILDLNTEPQIVPEANQFLSDLLLDPYSHHVHQSKSMECQDLKAWL